MSIKKTYSSYRHNTEKVIYFLLLDRKRRRPALEDDEEIAQKSRSELEAADPPRKRLDTCRINGTNSTSYGQISEGSPLTPRRQAFKYVFCCASLQKLMSLYFKYVL